MDGPYSEVLRGRGERQRREAEEREAEMDHRGSYFRLSPSSLSLS